MIHEIAPAARRHLQVRLAVGPADVAAAQRLRWQTFYAEMGARDDDGRETGLDADAFDQICDHLLVEDRGTIVGTYRLLRQNVARLHRGFYSAQEYRLEPIERYARANDRELLELGRSCVAPGYRDATTIQMLWRGIARYLSIHAIGGLFGCASFPGTNPFEHAEALSYLHHHHLAPPEIRAAACPERRVAMAMRDPGSYDPRCAARKLPPLIKGYLRVGAVVGDGAVIDREFNTVDVFMFMPVEAVAARYFDRFLKAA